eukprot:CAMPEP_0173378970 /NCGR_PEP_ID=MMETSP1356-20130122/2079_1 /TAXON_ID=77927 ORGANISM="Hemiselmis virescens, Strain PCC157" /NCGR_SAMPLE_ID=MMETSP1356 /ASSEMBLY_ACC=CAM_ASM_000847 /LENGTH=130 /DNA_ID=CAMNT_0014332231 /DNA_START=49 /DNA_END=441 /DNA_ORIENTATION=+
MVTTPEMPISSLYFMEELGKLGLDAGEPPAARKRFDSNKSASSCRTGSPTPSFESSHSTTPAASDRQGAAAKRGVLWASFDGSSKFAPGLRRGASLDGFSLPTTPRSKTHVLNNSKMSLVRPVIRTVSES